MGCDMSNEKLSYEFCDSDTGYVIFKQNDDSEQSVSIVGYAEDEDYSLLFSSSPDMLAALKSIIECFDCTDGRVWTNSSKRRALDAAHAAVKLAFGEKE